MCCSAVIVGRIGNPSYDKHGRIGNPSYGTLAAAKTVSETRWTGDLACCRRETVRYGGPWLLWCSRVPRRRARLEGAPRIIDGEPYDQLVLRAEGRVFKLVPIDMARRAPLRDQDPESNLVVRLFDRPQQKYQVQWKFIDRVELFEELVLGEAAGLVAEKKYDDAHQYFLFLQARSPEFPGLAAARQDCLFSEARTSSSRNAMTRSLLILTELYAQNRDYPGLREAMGSAVNALVESHFAAGKVAAARELVEQLASRYADHEVVATRRQELTRRARQDS